MDDEVRELHDRVIQQLFATGLGLASTLPRIPDAEIRDRVEQALAAIDRTIGEIRAAIHGPGTE